MSAVVVPCGSSVTTDHCRNYKKLFGIGGEDGERMGWICMGDGYVGRDGYVWEMDRWEGMDMCGRWICGKGWICVGDG